MEDTQTKKQPLITRHQFALIAFVLLVLGVLTWVRSGENIKTAVSEYFTKKEVKKHVAYKDRPEYRKYFEPKQDVLGATTETPDQYGNMIIGEDGKMHSVDEVGDVLGASTETIDTNLENIQVNLDKDSSQKKVQDYLSTTLKLEGEVLDGAILETALTSKDQKTINEFIKKVQTLGQRLEQMYVPEKVEKLHKLKILEFRSVARLLESFPDLEANPEQVANDFEIFIKVQSDQEQERQKVLSANS